MSRMKTTLMAITSVGFMQCFSISITCGDGICTSPEYAESCPQDCGDVVMNPDMLRNKDGQLFFWNVRPQHLVYSAGGADDTSYTKLVTGMVLHQENLRIHPSTTYGIYMESSVPDCVKLHIHTPTEVLWSASSGSVWTSPSAKAAMEVTVQGLCETNLSRVSISPRPISSNFGWKYYDVVDSILDSPVRIDPLDCRNRCLADGRCCAWQVCPGSEAEGCGGCYLLGRKPRESSGETKSDWFGAIERSKPSTPLGIDECRIFLLSQSAHEKDFYDSSSGKLQKYVNCANLVRADRTVPKQIFVGGVHIPTILVANHRNPDPRLESSNFNVLPHFYVLPFYDTNIGNIMKHTSAMNIVQSYEMQSFLRPGEVFVDAGSNLGSYTLSLAEHLGPSGMVLSFEPFRWLFQLLNANIALNGFMNCWTFQLALGDSPSTQSLLQPNLRFFSSPGGVRVSEQVTNFTAELKKQMYDLEWGSESVDVWRLDDVVFGGSMFSARKRAPQIDLLKIDVEGMELAVVRGSVEILKNLKPIVWVENVAFFDHGDTALIEFMKSVEYICWKSLSAGNDLICEPGDGSRSQRLGRVRKAPLTSTSQPEVCST